MYYRNDSSVGWTHFNGAVIAGVEAGSGIQLTPNSSGLDAIVEPVGDETNKGLTVTAKGSGSLTLGNSSVAVVVGQKFTVQFTPAVLAASTSVQSTITVTGLVAGRALLFTPTTPGLSMAYAFRAQCSTANELRFTQQNISASTIGTGESTARGILIQL
jgi:hypothetical protein